MVPLDWKKMINMTDEELNDQLQLDYEGKQSLTPS